jgi:hypothetical protein
MIPDETPPSRIRRNDEAVESITSPTKVKPIPMLRENGCGRLSVNHPTIG